MTWLIVLVKVHYDASSYWKR